MTFRTVPDIVRSGAGSMARSSMDWVCRASHIDPPDSDSLELIPRIRFEAAEVGRMTGEVTAVDGLDFSAWASYMSLRAATDLFKDSAGAFAVLGRSKSSDMYSPCALELRECKFGGENSGGIVFSPLVLFRCLRIALGRRTCSGLVGYGVGLIELNTESC